MEGRREGGVGEWVEGGNEECDRMGRERMVPVGGLAHIKKKKKKEKPRLVTIKMRMTLI